MEKECLTTLPIPAPSLEFDPLLIPEGAWRTSAASVQRKMPNALGFVIKVKSENKGSRVKVDSEGIVETLK